MVHLGLVEYRRTWDEQVTLAQAVRDGTQPNTLLLLEHPHVYTRGRLSKPEHLSLTQPELAERGVSVVDTDRGGLVTYHGPGQLVGYPIINLRNWGGPLKYVRTLEQVIIQTLADLGLGSEHIITFFNNNIRNRRFVKTKMDCCLSDSKNINTSVSVFG